MNNDFIQIYDTILTKDLDKSNLSFLLLVLRLSYLIEKDSATFEDLNKIKSVNFEYLVSNNVIKIKDNTVKINKKTNTWSIPNKCIDIDKKINNLIKLNLKTLNSNENNKTTVIPYNDILNAYNDICGTILPKCTIINKPRMQHVKARWNEYKNIQSLQAWRDLFNKIMESDFLTGKIETDNEKHSRWKCNFDFIISPSKFANIVEGNIYWNKQNKKTVIYSKMVDY